MKRIVAMALAFSLLVSGCGGDVVSSQGQPGLPQEELSASVSYPSEFPDALSSLPVDGPDVPSESSGRTSSLKPPVWSSERPQEGSRPAVSDSQSASGSRPESSSSQPAPSSGQPASSSQSASSEQTVIDLPAVTPPRQSAASESTPVSSRGAIPDEVAAVWLSYLEFLNIAQNKTRSQFTAAIDDIFKTSSGYGLNTVFVQVRPFGDALYESDYFPWSYVLTGEEGQDPGYDPLEIMVEKAREYDLRIEAWLNPYRIRAKGSSKAVSADNPARDFLRAGNGAVIEYDGGIYYNPASAEARQLICNGVVEIIENYDVDGIHFDDYFYPTTDSAFDAAYYRSYKNAGGALALADWRRENVNKLVRQVYSAVKNADADVLFGISPQARIDVNYGTQYADVERWLADGSYLDYICPQIYFGFEHQTVPYSSLLTQWEALAEDSGVALYVGLAAYKSGVSDTGAGSGRNEWIDSDDMLMRMVDEARGAGGYGGFVLYRYDSLFNPEQSVSAHIRRERNNLASIL